MYSLLAAAPMGDQKWNRSPPAGGGALHHCGGDGGGGAELCEAHPKPVCYGGTTMQLYHWHKLQVISVNCLNKTLTLALEVSYCSESGSKLFLSIASFSNDKTGMMMIIIVIIIYIENYFLVLSKVMEDAMEDGHFPLASPKFSLLLPDHADSFPYRSWSKPCWGSVPSATPTRTLGEGWDPCLLPGTCLRKYRVMVHNSYSKQQT